MPELLQKTRYELRIVSGFAVFGVVEAIALLQIRNGEPHRFFNHKKQNHTFQQRSCDRSVTMLI